MNRIAETEWLRLETGGNLAPGLAILVDASLDQQPSARPRRPQLETGAQLHTLRRVAPRRRDRRSYKRRTTSSNALRSAPATHSSGERRCGSRAPAG